MTGETLAEVGLTEEPKPPLQAVKEAVLPSAASLVPTPCSAPRCDRPGR